MAFQKKKKRKKSLTSVNDLTLSTGNVVPISIESMVLSFGGKKAYFKRLKYGGCPELSHGKGHPLPANIVDMDRDSFVSEVYELFKGFNYETVTAHSYFVQLTMYVCSLDKHKRNVDFTEENIFWYFDHKRAQMLKGDIAKGTLVAIKGSLVALLNAMGNNYLARKLPIIRKQRESITPHKTLSDSELTAIGKKLMTAYMGYSRFVLRGERPGVCPLYDAEELRRKGFDEDQISSFKKIAKHRIYNGNWRNQITRLAFMIISMWTGANLTPLSKLTRRDVIFKKGDGDTYEFNSVKSRALYAKQELGFGFVKRTKIFIESWLVVSRKLAPNEDAPLFPFLARNGEIKLDIHSYSAPQNRINKAIVPYGYPTINTSIFRKTRSNVLMRAFEDVFVVADANKSSVDTVSKSYLHGVQEAHEMQLAGAFIAQESMAFGIPKKLAIEKATYAFKDPLTEFAWNSKNETIPNKTPTGMRCKEPFGERAKRSLIPLKDLSSSNNGACVDFLGCFECEYHALIAERDDIWLMLSFQDSIIETMSRSSFNSLPSTKLEKTLNTVNAILPRYENVAPNEYQAALELNKSNPHPLYNDESAIEDLLEVYK